MISNIGNVSVVSCVSVLGANKIEKKKMICYYQYGSSLYCKSVNVVALSCICYY